MIKVGVLALARQQNGGTLLYTLSMLEGLAKLPKSLFEVTIFTKADYQEYFNLNLPVAIAPSFFSLIIGRLLGRKTYGEIDLMIAPVYSSELLVCGKPFVFTLHDLQERHYPENFSLQTRIWRRIINWLLANYAKRIVCESTFVREDIARYIGINKNKVSVLPAPPISILRDSMIDDTAILKMREKYKLTMRYIFYPAQFWPHKNHARLIDAFALILEHHPDVVLVLTGKQRDEYERVFKRVKAAGLVNKVRHIGYVEQEELVALYKAATVVAIPTLFESISIPVYEAFSVGCAVCASNVVGLPQQVGDAGLLFDPNSKFDIAEKICQLISDPYLRTQLIDRGRKRMLSVTHEQYAQNLSDLIFQSIK